MGQAAPQQPELLNALLSPRQAEVAHLLVQDMGVNKIANILGIRAGTIRCQLYEIFHRLDSSTESVREVRGNRGLEAVLSELCVQIMSGDRPLPRSSRTDDPRDGTVSDLATCQNPDLDFRHSNLSLSCGSTLAA
jgi:DNA-binding CsgD family transcriptional regulator